MLTEMETIKDNNGKEYKWLCTSAPCLHHVADMQSGKQVGYIAVCRVGNRVARSSLCATWRDAERAYKQLKYELENPVKVFVQQRVKVLAKFFGRNR